MKSRCLRVVFSVLVLAAAVAASAPAEAGIFNRGGGRGVFGSLRNRTSNATRQRTSQPLHMTNSRSAILDGVFGSNPYGNGLDRSWYVGR